MSTDLAILVPVLARPHRVAPLLDSVEATTPGVRVLFLVDSDDEAERDAIWKEMGAGRELAIGAVIDGGSYAAKINQGVRRTSDPLLFLGADDLEFKTGWFEAAQRSLAGPVEVVGVNDLLRRRPRRRDHATHFFLTRAYAELGTIDGAGGPLHEGYDHSFVDDEFIATAAKRGAYAYAPDSHVRHIHWMNRAAPDDAVYRKGRARFEQDRRLFRERSALWA
ncbi:MAG TPA: hypothetical protein VFK14_00225 [Solirubrobacterales bacterium]|nr:hypothetical protein [Solirubrobacterales bacterium]